MNGGAFSFSSILNGIKSFGNRVVNLGSSVWNSAPATALRQKLNDSNLQEKIVNGLSTGIHGAVDLANQEIERAVASRVEKRPVVENLESVLVEPPPVGMVTEALPVERVLPLAKDILVAKKRPRVEEEPPSYEELYGDKKVSVIDPVKTPVLLEAPESLRTDTVSLPSVPIRERPVVVESVSLPVPTTARPAVLRDTPTRPLRRPIPRRQNAAWQQTLGNIVGVGVKVQSKRRCY